VLGITGNDLGLLRQLLGDDGVNFSLGVRRFLCHDIFPLVKVAAGYTLE
jgi:hypothetical protein